MLLTELYSQLKWEKLKFYDISTNTDTLLFIDPNRIEFSEIWWSLDIIWKFWHRTVSYILEKNDTKLIELRSHLNEPNETHFWMSRNKSQGKGIWRLKAEDILNNIRKSKAFETWIISDIKDVSLFVEWVWPDNVSDIVTWVIKRFLVDFTLQQCEKHKIHTKSTLMRFLNPDLIWEKELVMLPYDKMLNYIMFVPTSIISDSSRFSNERIYRHFILEKNKTDYKTYSNLIENIKSPKITKKKLIKYHKQEHPSLWRKDLVVKLLQKDLQILTDAKMHERKLYENDFRKYWWSRKLLENN